MTKISEDWYNARLEVFELYSDNKIDFETFKKKIEEVDFKFKHPEEYVKKRIDQLKGKFEGLKEENGGNRKTV